MLGDQRLQTSIPLRNASQGVMSRVRSFEYAMPTPGCRLSRAWLRRSSVETLGRAPMSTHSSTLPGRSAACPVSPDERQAHASRGDAGRSTSAFRRLSDIGPGPTASASVRTRWEPIRSPRPVPAGIATRHRPPRSPRPAPRMQPAKDRREEHDGQAVLAKWGNRLGDRALRAESAGSPGEARPAPVGPRSPWAGTRPPSPARTQTGGPDSLWPGASDTPSFG